MVVDPVAAGARGARALVLSLVAVAVGGAAHTYVDGCLDATGLLLALGLVWPGAVAVLGRRRSPLALLGWSASVQVVTHVLLAATCGGPLSPPPGRVLLVHAAAVLVTSLVLARADERLWLADVVRRALARLLLPVVVPHVPEALLASPAPRTPLPRQSWHVTASRRRGPPSALLPTS